MDFEYDVEEMLNTIDGPLERVAIFKHAHRYEEAIQTLLAIRDYVTAEMICAGCRDNMFPFLLRSCLALDNPDLDFVLSVLHRWGRFVDILEVLRMIPDVWEIEILSDYLIEATIRIQGEKRKVLIWKGLERRRADSFELNYKVVQTSTS